MMAIYPFKLRYTKEFTSGTLAGFTAECEFGVCDRRDCELHRNAERNGYTVGNAIIVANSELAER